MRQLLLVAPLLLLPIGGQAQQVNRTPETFSLTVTPQELVTISNALAERPFREVAGLIQKLDRQAYEQMQVQQKVPEIQGSPLPQQGLSKP